MKQLAIHSNTNNFHVKLSNSEFFPNYGINQQGGYRSQPEKVAIYSYDIHDLNLAIAIAS